MAEEQGSTLKVSSLSIDIETNFESAVNGIESLITSLDKLKKAVSSGFELSGITSQLEKLSEIISNILDIGKNIFNFDNAYAVLNDFLEKLSNIPKNITVRAVADESSFKNIYTKLSGIVATQECIIYPEINKLYVNSVNNKLTELTENRYIDVIVKIDQTELDNLNISKDLSLKIAIDTSDFYYAMDVIEHNLETIDRSIEIQVMVDSPIDALNIINQLLNKITEPRKIILEVDQFELGSVQSKIDALPSEIPIAIEINRSAIDGLAKRLKNLSNISFDFSAFDIEIDNLIQKLSDVPKTIIIDILIDSNTFEQEIDHIKSDLGNLSSVSEYIKICPLLSIEDREILLNEIANLPKEIKSHVKIDDSEYTKFAANFEENQIIPLKIAINDWADFNTLEKRIDKIPKEISIDIKINKAELENLLSLLKELSDVSFAVSFDGLTDLVNALKGLTKKQIEKIDMIRTALESLQSVKLEKIGLESLFKEVSEFSKSVSEMSEIDTKIFDKISAMIRKLKNASDGEINLSSIAEQLNNLNTSLANVKTDNADKLIDLAAPLTKLKTASKFNADALLGEISKLNDGIENLNAGKSEKFKTLVSNIEKLEGIVKVKIPVTLANNMQKLADGMTALTAALPGFKEAIKGRFSLAGLVNNLKAINEPLTTLDASNFSKLEGLTTSMLSLQQLNGIKISSSIAKQLNELISALKNLDISDNSLSDKITQLIDALMPLSQMGKATLDSYIRQLKKLPEVIKGLEAVDLEGFVEKTKLLAEGLTPLANQLYVISNSFYKLPDKVKQLANVTTKLTDSNVKAQRSYINLLAAVRLFRMTVMKVVSVIGDCITESNQYIEISNLFAVAMGSFANEAKEYAETVNNIMGIDVSDWMEYEAVFMNLNTTFGITSERAYIMSKNLTQLAYDISSLHNMKVDEIAQKLESAISGEIEPIRRLGVDLSKANLSAMALSLGIDKTFDSMTQAEKAQLRYYAIMQQTITAQGDMARTLTSPSNQLRLLRSQLTMTAKTIGNLFIPALNAILPYAIALVKVIQLLATAIANFFGIDVSFDVDYSDLSSGISGIGDSADDATDSINGASDALKELNNNMLDIDELNVISTDDSSDSTGTGSGSSGTSSGWSDFDLPDYDFLSDAIQTTIDDIIDSVKEWLGLTEDINSLTDLLHTNLGHILLVVGSIAAGFLAWTLGNTILNEVSQLQKVLASLDSTKQILLGVSLVVTGLTLEATGIWEILTEGIDLQNMLQTVIGAVLTTIGGALIGSGASSALASAGITTAAVEAGMGTQLAGALFGGGLAAVIAGIPAFVTGIYSSITEGISGCSAALTEVGATLAGGGAGAIGAALGAWAGPIGVGIGALAGLVVAAIANFAIWLYQNWDEVSAYMNEKWDAVTSYMETVPEKIGTVIDSIVEWFESLPEKVGYALGYVVGKVVSWATDTDTTVNEEVPKTINSIYEWWLTAPNKISEAVSTTKDKVVTWATETKEKFSEKTEEILTALKEWWGETPGKIYEAIEGTYEKLAIWASECIFKEEEEVPKIIESIMNFFLELPSKLYELGPDIWEGFISGLTDTKDAVLNAISNFATGFIDGFKDGLGIHSPSTEFEEVGQYAMEGFTVGIESNTAAVQTTITSLVETIKTAFTEQINAETWKTYGAEIVTAFGTAVSDSYTDNKNIITTWAEALKKWFSNNSYGSINADSWKEYANNIIMGFKSKISTTYSTVRTTVVTWAEDVKKRFTDSSYGGVNSTTWEGYATDIITGFANKISSSYSKATDKVEKFALAVIKAFEYPDGDSIVDTFEEIGENLIQGFIDGVNNMWDEAARVIRRWAEDMIDEAMDEFDEASPSKVFKSIGSYVIEGFDAGLESTMGDSYTLMKKWVAGINSYTPNLAVSVDTSRLKNYNSRSLESAIAAQVSSDYRIDAYLVADGFAEAMEELYTNRIEPTIKAMASDVKRQADKEETLTVKIGNKTISNAVTTQQKANGYRFRTT